MAIYHLTVTLVSRGRGQSVVAAAAYRSGTTLRDERYGITHRYAGRRGVIHAEILAPPDAPSWAVERDTLWNRVEARENRKDAQLARLIEVGLPIELEFDQRVGLLRDFVRSEFVARGMIADLSIRGGDGNPHAHVLLTLRGIGAAGFGPKERSWNGKASLLAWRAAWALKANLHLAQAGHGVRIDHRTLEAQHIELLPGRRIGIGRSRQADANLPGHLKDRVSAQRHIALENGALILEDPTVALRAITHASPIFTAAHLEQFLRSRTGDYAQYEQALRAVTESPECVPVGPGSAGPARFTSRDMLEAQTSVLRRAAAMIVRQGHAISRQRLDDAVAGLALDPDVRLHLAYLCAAGDLKAVALDAALQPPLLDAARQVWASAGFDVCSADSPGEPPTLSRSSVLLVENAGRLRLKELERVLAAADHARALAVCIADAEELHRMKAAPAMTLLLQRDAPAVH